jgi:hypothetical protein
VALFAKLRADGFHTITAQIPHDRLPADDQRTIAVRAVREVKVLLVDGTQTTNKAQADDFFIRNALVPVPANDVNSYYIKTTTITTSALASTSLDDYDAVFFLDVDQIDSSIVPTLTNYVHQGGGLVLFPGPSCNIDFYNQDLSSDGFLPARLSPFKGDPNPAHGDKFFTLPTSGYDHPIVTLWNDPSAGTLASAHFYAYYPLEPIPWKKPAEGELPPSGGQARVILHFAQNSDPLAVEHTYGSGRVILFASTPTIAWNDLPVRQAFVPLMQRVLGSIVERQDEGLNIGVGRPFSYTVNNDFLRKDFSVSIPGQTDPARVTGQVVLTNGVPTIAYDDTDYAGAYRVAIATDPPSIVYFAAQSDSAESDLTTLTDTQIKSLSEVADVFKWSPGVVEHSLTTKLTEARVGTELWFPLLIAALVVAAFETLMAQVFTQSK